MHSEGSHRRSRGPSTVGVAGRRSQVAGREADQRGVVSSEHWPAPAPDKRVMGRLFLEWLACNLKSPSLPPSSLCPSDGGSSYAAATLARTQ